MVTQCPACGTRFRITGSQMGRAGGRVRCGACLEIFPAPDSLSIEAENPPGAAAGAGGTNGIAGYERAGESAVQRQPGKQVAGVRKVTGKGSGAAESQSARGGSGTGWWVRWALAVAVLTLILQVVLYLA